MSERAVWWVVALIGLVSTLLYGNRLLAQPLTELQEISVYAVAYGQYHGPREWLDQRPPVRLVAPEVVCARANQPAPCVVLGVYHEGVVYLSGALDFANPDHVSVLLHEYVHDLQQKDKGPVADCPDWYAREVQAYRIQREVLIKAQRYLAARDVGIVLGQLPRCPS